MSNPICVSLSGPSFSFLLYENTKSKIQQEGFLLGELEHKETKTITDNDQEQITRSDTIKINSVIPCPQPNYFYNGLGHIDKYKLENLLGNQFDKVVGWYSYHRMSGFKFTLRQKIIHRQLQDFFQTPPNLFLCGLLIQESSDGNSTHLYSQSFIRRTSLGYDRLPITIANLSEPNNTYKTSETPSETFQKILSDIKLNTKKIQGVSAISRIQNAVQKHTDNVVEELANAECVMHQLEQEIVDLIEKVKFKNDSSKSSASTISNKEDLLMVIDEIEDKTPTIQETSLKAKGKKAKTRQNADGEPNAAIPQTRLRKRNN